MSGSFLYVWTYQTTEGERSLVRTLNAPRPLKLKFTY